MKKPINKKLVLSRETVSNLNEESMNQVRGGYISYTCPDFKCNTNYNCTTGCTTATA